MRMNRRPISVERRSVSVDLDENICHLIVRVPYKWKRIIPKRLRNLIVTVLQASATCGAGIPFDCLPAVVPEGFEDAVCCK